ncbi:MAG: sulfatase [Opitutae bacterium]|nr:sulfatase [Opitutae bacterium]
MRPNSSRFLTLATLALAGAWPLANAAAPSRPNVLFIAVDDLRPELGCYGSAFIQTPNIDRFARTAALFERHYTQFAVCIPSRVALLTGLSPERTHQTYGPHVWEKVPGAQPWGRTFQRAGYEAVSLGKIWHIETGTLGDSFDVLERSDRGHAYGDPTHDAKLKEWQQAKRARGGNRGDDNDLPGGAPIAEGVDRPDRDYIDGALADDAIAQLQRLKGGAKPFMLAVGFHKPHIPFVAPKRYWDLYDPQALPLAPNPQPPRGVPAIAWSGNPNFHSYTYDAHAPLPKGDWAKETMSDETARWIRHGYFACVSFVDAQIGRVLDALEREGLAENTIVVLWGDHGFHLGDLNLWGKQTNFEEAAHSPLIVRVPGVTQSGARSPALVETIDILPTLTELCGIAPLAVTDGTSFAPVLREPARVWKDAIFHVFDRRWAFEESSRKELVIGHAVRTAGYRLVEWRRGWSMTGERVATELYDYTADPLETRNVADDAAYAEVRAELEARLRTGPARLNP